MSLQYKFKKNIIKGLSYAKALDDPLVLAGLRILTMNYKTLKAIMNLFLSNKVIKLVYNL